MTEPVPHILHEDDVKAVIEDVSTDETEVAALIAAAMVPVHATSTQLNAVAGPFNVSGKVVGKAIFNTTLGLPVWAVGAAPGDVWVKADGTTANTPV